MSKPAKRHTLCGLWTAIPEGRCDACSSERDRHMRNAAPELLSMLDRIVAEITTHDPDVWERLVSRLTIEQARAAITKAGGR